MRRAGTSTNSSSTAAGVACRASGRRSSRTTPSWSAPSNVYWRKPNEIFYHRAVPRFRRDRRLRSGQEGREEGADCRPEEAAGAHEGLQRKGRGQEGRCAQELHERLPQGRGRRPERGAESSAEPHDGLQQTGDREEAEGRRAQEIHEQLPQELRQRSLHFAGVGV